MRKLINGKNAVCLYEGKYKDVTYHFFVTTFLIFSILVSHTCLLSLRSEENFLVFAVCIVCLYTRGAIRNITPLQFLWNCTD